MGSEWEKGSSSPGTTNGWDWDDEPLKPMFHRFVDSFKRDPHATTTPKGTLGAHGQVFDVETAALATAQSPLQRKLKGRHLQMIAIGGSIGMSLLSFDAWIVNVPPLHRHTANRSLRLWTICRFGRSVVERWTGFGPHRVLPDRSDAVLHRPRPR
jgi:hypothetical protein